MDTIEELIRDAIVRGLAQFQGAELSVTGTDTELPGIATWTGRDARGDFPVRVDCREMVQALQEVTPPQPASEAQLERYVAALNRRLSDFIVGIWCDIEYERDVRGADRYDFA